MQDSHDNADLFYVGYCIQYFITEIHVHVVTLSFFMSLSCLSRLIISLFEVILTSNIPNYISIYILEVLLVYYLY